MTHYKENSGGYVALYFDRIVAYCIEQSQEVINTLVIEEKVEESEKFLEVVSQLEKLNAE